MLSHDWNITKAWNFLTYNNPSEKVVELLNVYDYPSLVILFPESINYEDTRQLKPLNFDPDLPVSSLKNLLQGVF